MKPRPDGEELIPGPVDVDSLTADERLKLGPALRQVREQRGIAAQDLAVAAGIDRKTLRTIETAQHAGQPAKLRAILEALNIPQVGDYDRFSERTRSFIFATAPIFDQLPESIQGEAQHDVVVLLTGKLARAAGIRSIGVGGVEQARKVASEADERDRGGDDGQG